MSGSETLLMRIIFRCEQAVPSCCEWDVLTKVKNYRVIYPKELKEFEKGLSEHHLALGPDGKHGVITIIIITSLLPRCFEK